MQENSAQTVKTRPEMAGISQCDVRRWKFSAIRDDSKTNRAVFQRPVNGITRDANTGAGWSAPTAAATTSNEHRPHHHTDTKKSCDFSNCFNFHSSKPLKNGPAEDQSITTKNPNHYKGGFEYGISPIWGISAHIFCSRQINATRPKPAQNTQRFDCFTASTNSAKPKPMV